MDKDKDNNQPQPSKEIRIEPYGCHRRALQRVRDYDAYWGVTGYYEDSDGNDIRDRD